MRRADKILLDDGHRHSVLSHQWLVRGFVEIAVDITDLKRNQDDLTAAQELEKLDVLVSGLAHNFNSLMAVIIAEADLALSDLPADSAPHGNVERMSATARRAADLIFRLMEYAGNLAAGPLMPVNVSDVVEETVQPIKSSVPSNITFCLRLAAKVPLIHADISQIRRVVMNLLTNACESLTNRTGSVCVSTSCVRVDPAAGAKYQASLAPGDYVRLCVTDSGCGIPEEVRGRIFDPFYTTKFLGRGLGLAVVQGIVLSLGGAIDVQSNPEQGSSFEILFPCMRGGSAFWLESQL